MRTLFTVFAKEFLENLRDRRTLLSALLFGPLFGHHGIRGAGWWNGQMQQAGFQVVEEGTRPATLYILAKRI